MQEFQQHALAVPVVRVDSLTKYEILYTDRRTDTLNVF